MILKAATWMLLLLILLEESQGATVTFSGRLTLQVVDEGNLNAATKAGVADAKNTGSKLFDSSAIGKDEKLGTYVYVKDFKSTKSKYFRAHPVLVRCIDKVFSELESTNAGYRLLVESGFKTKAEATNGKEHDVYARSGTAAIITFRLDSKVKDVLEIAKQAMMHCPAIFASIQRDIGITLMAKGVGIHMRGLDDKQPFYASDGGKKSTADFKTWCLARIDEGFDDVPKVTNCVVAGLKTGETNPKGVTSPEKVVGRISYPVTRGDVVDFQRLHQFQGNVVEFENSEGSSAWCGKVGNPCRSSPHGIYGSALDDRIADRTMSPRMYNVLKKLQKPVRQVMNDKLVVTEAWDEPHSGATNGDSPANSLHYEGRQVEVKLKNGGSLPDLTKYAICAGADYVKNNGASVTIAVRKQATLEGKEVEFSSEHSLLEVAMPYKLRDRYIHPLDEDPESYPFFYKDYQDDKRVGDEVTVADVAGETCGDGSDCPEDDDEYRYFRLSPSIAKCLGLLRAAVMKETKKTLETDTVYLSNRERGQMMGNDDPRGSEMSFGYGMQVTYPDSPDLSPCRLAEMAVEQCAKVAQENEEEDEQQLGVGVYKDFLYLDIRAEFTVWAEDPKSLHKECNDIEKFEDDLGLRFTQTLLGQRIAPDDDEIACVGSDHPEEQSPTYKYVHSPDIQKRRVRRQTTKPDDECVPKTNTPFCQETKKHRDRVVEDIWEQISLKYHVKPVTKIREALEGCLGVCGTCMEGNVWEDKTEHCQNLIHWLAFTSCGDEDGKKTVHFYASDNLVARRLAYYPRDQMSTDRTDLYGLLGYPVRSLYRPDPDKGVQEDLYGPTNNPSPLMDLIKRLCAFTARQGKAVVWLADDTEATAMKNVLKDLMVYNKNLTSIDLMVPDETAAETVGSVVENLVAELTKASCRKHSRPYITPFEIKTGWPQSRKKRDAEEEHDYAEEFILERRNHEHNWIENL